MKRTNNCFFYDEEKDLCTIVEDSVKFSRTLLRDNEFRKEKSQPLLKTVNKLRGPHPIKLSKERRVFINTQGSFHRAVL